MAVDIGCDPVIAEACVAFASDLTKPPPDAMTVALIAWATQSFGYDTPMLERTSLADRLGDAARAMATIGVGVPYWGHR